MCKETYHENEAMEYYCKNVMFAFAISVDKHVIINTIRWIYNMLVKNRKFT